MKFTPLVPCIGCGESLVEPGRLCLDCREGARPITAPDRIDTAQFLPAREVQNRAFGGTRG